MCDDLGRKRGGRCMLDRKCPWFGACESVMKEKLAGTPFEGCEVPPDPEQDEAFLGSLDRADGEFTGRLEKMMEADLPPEDDGSRP
jgi:hypothetical protein